MLLYKCMLPDIDKQDGPNFTFYYLRLMCLLQIIYVMDYYIKKYSHDWRSVETHLYAACHMPREILHNLQMMSKQWLPVTRVEWHNMPWMWNITNIEYKQVIRLRLKHSTSVRKYSPGPDPDTLKRTRVNRLLRKGVVLGHYLTFLHIHEKLNF